MFIYYKMTQAKWKEAVRIAKIKLDMNPESYVMIKGELLKEAQIVYQMLLLTR